MRTVSAKEVADRALRKAGLSPATVPEETMVEVFEHIDEFVRDGWDSAAWPEICPIEERARRDIYRADRQYYANDEVYYPTTLKYYRATATTLGNAPDDADFWEEITAERWMAKAQDEKPIMDIVVAAWEEDPRDCLRALEVRVTDQGDYVWLGSDQATLWVQYRLAAPSWRYEVVVPSTTYAADAVVYNPADGECYAALVEALGSQIGDGEKWEMQPLPLVLRDYVVLRIASALKASDEQDATAAKLDAMATRALEREQAKFLYVPAGAEGGRAWLSSMAR